MPRFQRNHIVVSGRTEEFPYTSVSRPNSSIDVRQGLNRREHGEFIGREFSEAIAQFRRGEDESEFVYLVFKSASGFALDLAKFDNKDCRIASLRTIETDGILTDEVTVYLNKKAISKFLKKTEEYVELNSAKGNPRHQSLLANIEEIRAATLQSFWQEPELPFPDSNQVVWWEVWLNREAEDDDNINPIAPFDEQLREVGVTISNRYLKFPDNWVVILQGTALQLAASLLYTDKLSELRKPKDTADFFISLEVGEQQELLDNLRERVDHVIVDSNISICLLDTGVNRANPLLTTLLPERNLDSINPAWTKADTNRHGHGTPMAGLALYGDLSDLLGTNSRVQIYHHLESVKLIEPSQPHNPELYGAVTQEAISRGVLINPQNKRIVCLAITSEDEAHLGRPSSWSSAIDQTLFGSVDEPNEATLLCVSAGNLLDDERINYPIINDDFSIEDPAQAFNAITVGAYTLKEQLDSQEFIGAGLIAQRGQMAPCSKTSVPWNNEWCKKPDIVMEGGNNAIHNGGVISPNSLQLLSLGKGSAIGGGPWLATFADTSAATALASKFAAELYYRYPRRWPETIRGLIIHSANWTSGMLGNRPINALNLEQKHALLEKVGYGVPNLSKAMYSANNSLSLIVERVIKPFRLEGSQVKTDKFHLFDLPWPIEELQALFNAQVRLKITLSYFIEPNPGSKRYELAASYRSHGLRFKVIARGESIPAFKARVSKAMREEDYQAEGGESWLLGQQVRDKGSIHKDVWEGSAADLARRNKIAVYPVGGWWKNRRKHERYNNSVRYSLIVTVETPDEEVDIYSSVLAQIPVDIELIVNNN